MIGAGSGDIIWHERIAEQLDLTLWVKGYLFGSNQ